ncbi:SpoIIE family protein phosphatase [Actinacidiphila glaucinigra]|uniref:SpoIIE family protein phosphatase n=1 Tax=Actinacidiphila glaucinigra TaxID=235986 RepID=UPI003AF35291
MSDPPRGRHRRGTRRDGILLSPEIPAVRDDFDETAFRLFPGDALLLYSDGLTEARARRRGPRPAPGSALRRRPPRPRTGRHPRRRCRGHPRPALAGGVRPLRRARRRRHRHDDRARRAHLRRPTHPRGRGVTS